MRRVGARRLPLGPMSSFLRVSVSGFSLRRSRRTTYLPRVATISSTSRASARARAALIVFFFASTISSASIFCFARNSCVFLQVIHPGR